ncbi:3-oxoacyl-ACP synthase [Mucilaginibacter hurinus]|uniref:3-oxoacyl-ACP synthase n=1 Tax=Mucilaginibacter hurinus TaxID=2201324 RepID=A0A367GLS5_9SPHI|nr:3-oxoacyl-ACP synthase [Mucilaginibacter hurinus]RCH53641.1 3-oxoacyl-ACP synthase [Mucilaginibacter hurinus]
MLQLKQKLYNACLSYVQSRINTTQQAINTAQQAGKDDTKSSAGDKYETGREMAQQEENRNVAQLNEANKLKVALNFINPTHTSPLAEAGSLIFTNKGNFYLSISAGTLNVDGQVYFAVSPASPIGLQLKGKRRGDEFSLNGHLYSIQNII